MIQSQPKNLVKDSILNRYGRFLYEIDTPYDQVIEVFMNFENNTCINMYTAKISNIFNWLK